MLKRLRGSQLVATALARWRNAGLKSFPERQRAVYVVQYGQTYKIGLSANPVQRIQRFMLPEVVATLRVYWVPNAQAFEKALHKKYAAHREFREWFRLPESAFTEMDALAEDWKNTHSAPQHPDSVHSVAHGRCDSPLWTDYERRKADWQQANPEATSTEYQSAMRRIARECGV